MDEKEKKARYEEWCKKYPNFDAVMKLLREGSANLDEEDDFLTDEELYLIVSRLD